MLEFADKKNFLIKYLTLELFEKLFRLEKYINTCERFDRANNTTQIVDLFKKTIDIIGKEVNELCAEINTDLSDDHIFAYIIKISLNAKAISKIHEELKNLHPSWVLPEIRTFAKEIIPENLDVRQEINVILSDNYTFLERNLSKKFEIALKRVYHYDGNKPSIIDNHSFILPKIEFSNPLNWTIIVHEAGHLQKQIIENLINNPDILPDDVKSLDKDVLKSWAEEIFCDVYAASVLGPAYFISFITFALLSTMDYGIGSYSEMHPSVLVRATILINYLKKNQLLFMPEWGLENYVKIFYECLVKQNEIFDDLPKESIDGLTKFNRNLRKSIKDLELNRFSISRSESKLIIELVEKLKAGIPIGSICANDKKDSCNRFNLDTELTKQQIDALKKDITERSCETWEILNAGWIYKLEVCYPNGGKIFFDEKNEKDLKAKIDEYGKIINFLDERLLASLNTSQIINIIESKHHGSV